MSKPESYDDKIISDCPDCGHFLVGEVCHECQCYWKFEGLNSEEEQ